MRLYAITDGSLLSTHSTAETNALITLAARWAAGGVEVIQIREKQLTSRALEKLVKSIVAAVRGANLPGSYTQVLVNGRPDVAIAAGADGVHLPGQGSLTPEEVRRVYAGSNASLIISVACHSISEVEKARHNGATMALFSPVFGKVLRSGEVTSGVGLETLQTAARVAGKMPVFALGGVNAQNAAACIGAGAAGVAAIRLFQSPGWEVLAP